MNKNKILEDIYKRYAGRMLSICKRYVVDENLAMDLMQDAYIQIYKHLETFENRGEGSMKAWMEKITVNTCLQYLRKKDLLRNSKDISEDNYSIITNDNIIEKNSISILEDSVKAIPKEVLMHFIEKLPTGYRTVFYMYVFENMSHKEIALRLGIKEKSSSSQYFRAKKLLAKMILVYK